ncbi:MAG: ATP-binding protein, partial [Gemmatimonadaceae bacterium]
MPQLPMSIPAPHHRVLAESAPDPIVTIDESSTILWVNPAAERTFGYRADEMVGESLLMLIPERFRAAHRRGISHYVATGTRSMVWQGLRVSVLTKSGVEIPIEISFGEFEWEGRRLFSGFLRDISERVASDTALADANAQLHDQAAELEQQVEEAQSLSEELARNNAESETRAQLAARSADRARRLLTISTGLNKAIGAAEVADLILEVGMPAVGADAGSFALMTHPSEGHTEFEIIRTRGFAAELTETYKRFPLQPGRPLSDAVLSGAPVLLESREAACRRYPILADVGYEALVALPVLNAGQAVAGITFSFSEPQHFDEQTETFLRTVGEQCAQALARARMYDEKKRQAERGGFLADASRLLASSPDYEATLKSIAESAVPALGDWCAVDIVNEPTLRQWPPTLTRLAVVHKNPEKKALGLSLEERFPTDWSSLAGSPAALRDATTQFVPVVTDKMLMASARNAEHLAVLRELRFCSVIIVPLIARGLTLGTLTLVMSDSGRQYDQDDVSLVTDLADHAAIAIDNARLFRAAQQARTVAEDATAQAASASKAKSNFLATMSHEIRTPINAVLGYSELLSLELAGPLTEEQRAQVARIRASTAHLLTLVNEVLDLAKIESGTLRVETREALAGDTSNAALSLVSPQAAKKGIKISERCEGACGLIYLGDPDRVRQILANLISNAVKFTNSGGTISVRCDEVVQAPTEASLQPSAPYVAFHVTDTGVGIAAGQLRNIFEAFVQAGSENQNPYTREQTGTGLGLAISRQLAHSMLGEITVESELGVGSTFTLFMPAVDVEDSTFAYSTTPAAR